MGGVEELLDFRKVDYETFNYMIMAWGVVMEEGEGRVDFLVGGGWALEYTEYKMGMLIALVNEYINK
jgi:hypothetical protein